MEGDEAVRMVVGSLLISAAALGVPAIGSALDGDVIVDSPFDDSADAHKERIVVLEYLLTLGHPDALQEFDPTDDELEIAQRRLDWYGVDEVVYGRARDVLGSEFGGIWLGFDGVINIAYTGDAPDPALFPPNERQDIPIRFHERSLSEGQARLEAERIDSIYDVTTGDFVSRQGQPNVAKKPSQSHNDANTMAGIANAIRCDTTSGEVTLGFRITWRNQPIGGTRIFGYLHTAHALPDDCDGNGVDPDVGRRIIDDTQVDTRQNGTGQWIAQNRVGRGIEEQTGLEMDGAAISCPTTACGTRENNIHLAGSPKFSGGGDDDPWPNYDNHDTEVQDVDQIISVNDTLCFTGRRADGVVCGWHGGWYDGQAYIIDFANGYPGPGPPLDGGDSGSPVYTILDAAGPRAVGIVTHEVSLEFWPYTFQYGLYFRVDNILFDLNQEFALINEIEVCGEAADDSWDYDCD